MAQTSFEPRQRAGRDARLFGKVRQGYFALFSEALEAWSDGVERAVEIDRHIRSLPNGNKSCNLASQVACLVSDREVIAVLR